tara:strand:+ start:489 stop:1076 length:588 start_codon:yes stop_codon:yes gene_type:complete
MPNIHISAPPGLGKTSLCLVNSRKVLNEDGRVFWVSGDKLNHERFSQIMSSVPLSKASKFHLLNFGDESLPNNGFEDIINQLIRMCASLESTKLVVIDGWDSNMQSYDKKNRISSLSSLIQKSNNLFEIHITSLSYENAGKGDEKYRIRASNEIEKLGFESWLIIPHLKDEGVRTIEKPNEKLNYLMKSDGIEFL